MALYITRAVDEYGNTGGHPPAVIDAEPSEQPGVLRVVAPAEFAKRWPGVPADLFVATTHGPPRLIARDDWFTRWSKR